MSLDNALAKINIKPAGIVGKSTITVNMPIWIRKSEDGKFYANLALFGGITTYAKNESELDVAICEVLMGFFEFANKHGKGWKEELNALGWQIKNKNVIKFKVKHNDRHAVNRNPMPATYDINPAQPMYQSMLKTGTAKTVSFEV